jgi:hypothetical protein
MLAQVRGATTVPADIVGLDLGERFDAVVLGSHLVNVPSARLRQELLATCRRHRGPRGVVLIERHDPALRERLSIGELGRVGSVSLALEALRWRGCVARMTLRYRADDGRCWRQRFATRVLDDAAFDRALHEAGLERSRWLDAPSGWAVAR